MAKISDGVFKNWQDTETIHSSEYKQEREMLRAAVNDNHERLSSLEESTEGVQLGNAQLQKITEDDGGVKISITSTQGDILDEVIKAGKGFHTFYAIGGSFNLPPSSNLSIRGHAHITNDNPAYGYVKAIDYKGRTFSNYVDNNVWTGWKEPLGWTDGDIAESLNSMKHNGIYYVNPGTSNAPTSNSGVLIVTSPSIDQSEVSQIVVDLITGKSHTRGFQSSVWTSWRSSVAVNDAQDTLWSGTMYPTEANTITPSKKLADCKSGWLLVWSDMDSGEGANDFNWATTFVPKSFPSWGGTNFMCSVPAYVDANGTGSLTVVKQLSITNTTITGNSTNDEGDVNDVVLRKVIEV